MKNKQSRDYIESSIESIYKPIYEELWKINKHINVNRYEPLYLSLLYTIDKEWLKKRLFVSEDFTDVPDQAWYRPYLERNLEKGIVQGYPDGSFRPSNSINRIEAIKMVVSALGFEPNNSDSSTAAYNDVSNSQWYSPYLAFALNHSNENIVNSASKNMSTLISFFDQESLFPGKALTRAEAAHMVANALSLEVKNINSYQDSYIKTFTDLETTHKHYRWIMACLEWGIMRGDSGRNTFRPNDPVNRAEMLKLTYKILEIKGFLK